MQELLITRPQPDEAAAMTQLALDSKRYWGYPEEWLDLWREGMRITPQKLRAREFWAGRINDEIVAVYSLRRMAHQACELEDFWVAPAYIGRGLGRRMFQHLQARLEALGAAHLRIVSDPHAVPFYERMGAVRVGAEASVPQGRTLPVLMYLVKR